MRRKDREVTDFQGINEIIQGCKTCHVAMIDGDMPYIVPLSFGYRFVNKDVLELYFHSAKTGKKLDLMRADNRVCFEMANEGEIIRTETPCDSGYYFSSVIGLGKIEFIEDAAGKCEALSIIVKHQTGQDAAFNSEQADTVCVYRIVSADYSGKRKPRPPV